MAGIETLEAHLRATPDDWSTWLVYGDHLSGQGDARGELIRLEHQFHFGRLNETERKTLGARIDALIAEHRARWLSGVPAGSRHSLLHGFVVGLDLAWGEATGGELAAFMDSNGAQLLSTLAVSRLDGDEENLDDDDLEDPEYDEEGQVMRGLDAEAVGQALDGVLACDLSRVVTLSCAYLEFQKDGARRLAKASGLDALQRLDLRYCFIGDEGLAALCEAPFFRNLRALHLQANLLTAKGIKALAAVDWKHLTFLDLRRNELKSSGAKALASAKLLSSLTSLALHREDVGAAGVKTLATAKALPAPLKTYWKALHATAPERPEDD